MDEPNPFAQEEEPGDIASVAYRYICGCLWPQCHNYFCYQFSTDGLTLTQLKNVLVSCNFIFAFET